MHDDFLEKCKILAILLGGVAMATIAYAIFMGATDQAIEAGTGEIVFADEEQTYISYTPVVGDGVIHVTACVDGACGHVHDLDAEELQGLIDIFNIQLEYLTP